MTFCHAIGLLRQLPDIGREVDRLTRGVRPAVPAVGPAGGEENKISCTTHRGADAAMQIESAEGITTMLRLKTPALQQPVAAP